MSGKVRAKEDFSVSAVIYVTKLFAEAIFGDHLAGNICSLLDITGCSNGYIAHFEFLSHTAAHGGDDVVVHLILGLEKIIVFRKVHGVSAGTSSGHDGNFVYVHVLGK